MLNLNDLGDSSIPGITPALGNALAEAAAICLVSKLGFAHFKRRKRGDPPFGGTEWRGVPVHQGRRLTVRNPPRPATGGGAGSMSFVQSSSSRSPLWWGCIPSRKKGSRSKYSRRSPGMSSPSPARRSTHPYASRHGRLPSMNLPAFCIRPIFPSSLLVFPVSVPSKECGFPFPAPYSGSVSPSVCSGAHDFLASVRASQSGMSRGHSPSGIPLRSATAHPNFSPSWPLAFVPASPVSGHWMISRPFCAAHSRTISHAVVPARPAPLA